MPITDYFATKHIRLVYLGLIISALLHFLYFSYDLVGIHVWRQTLTQLNIINFATRDFNILHPRINNLWVNDGLFPTDFPLMQWLVACLYKIFGEHLLITRVSMFAQSMVMITGMYLLIKQVSKSSLIAGLTAFAFTFSPIIFYYGLNPLPDNLALCLAVFGLYYTYCYKEDEKIKSLILTAGFIGLSTLIKLPFILYYIPLGWIFIQQRKYITTGIITLFSISPALAWYSYVIPYWKGNGIVQGMTKNAIDIPKIIDICTSHLVSNLPELYINYISFPFFLIGLVLCFRNSKVLSHKYIPITLLLIGCFLYFFFEINMIGKEHDYYMFPFLIPTFLVVGYGLKNAIAYKPKWQSIIILLILLTPITAYLRIKARWDYNNPGCNRDLFDHKIALQNAIPDTALCIIADDYSHNIYLYHLEKRGFVFDSKHISEADLQLCLKKGARYLYSDCREVDETELIQSYIKDTLMVKGTMKVFELKGR